MPESRRTSSMDEHDDPRRAEVETLLDQLRRSEIEKAELRQQLADLRRERRVAMTGMER